MSDAKIKFATQPDGDRLAILYCEGCKEKHFVRVDGPHKWGFNESVEAPTFSPSVLVRYRASDPSDADAVALESVCHFFVRDGKVQYLGDCTHVLAGKEVEMRPVTIWPERG